MLLDKSISIVGCYFEISKCSIVILFKKEKKRFLSKAWLSRIFFIWIFSSCGVALVKAFLPSRWLSRFVVLVGFEFKRWLLVAHLVIPITYLILDQGRGNYGPRLLPSTHISRSQELREESFLTAYILKKLLIMKPIAIKNKKKSLKYMQ